MTEDHKPDSLKDLDDRLKRLRRQEEGDQARGRRTAGATSGLGFGLRIGVELVAALGVGVGIGVLLDRWLGTTPWLMLVFFILGACAGFLNIYRVMTRSTQVVGHGGKPRDNDGGPPRG